jgi:hypothetical protein
MKEVSNAVYTRWDSSDSKVTGFRLDDWGSISGRVREIFLWYRHRVNSGAHAASYPLDVVGSVLGGKADHPVLPSFDI